MNYKRLQDYWFLILFGSSLVLTFFVFRPYLDLIIFSGVLALLVWPVYRRILKFFRGQKSFAAFATVLLTLAILLLPLTFFVVSLAVEMLDLFNRVRQVQFQDIEGTLSRIVNPTLAHRLVEQLGLAIANLADYTQPIVTSITSNVFTVFSNSVTIVLGITLVLMSLYYVLKDGPALKKTLLDISPLSDSNDTLIFDRIREAIVGVAYGSFLMALAKGIIAGILFLVLGLPAPVFWGAMIALASFIPVVGTALITVPAALYLFFTGQFVAGLVLSIVSVLVIGLVDNFLGPFLIRRRVDIHPLLILFSILGGLSVFGPLGIFFGPVILSISLALLDIYKKEFRQGLDRDK